MTSTDQASWTGLDPNPAPETAVVTPQPVSSPAPTTAKPFFPTEPDSLAGTGLTDVHVEALVLRLLATMGSATGFAISEHLRLPFRVVREVLVRLKQQLLVGYRGTAPMSDYDYELSEAGLDRARRHSERSTYCGAAPVPLADYVRSVHAQSVRRVRPRLADVRRAFADLLLPDDLLSQVGQAVNSGQGLFLYGAPGNGKTSLAERVVRAVDECIWIPRTITVTGEIIRVFDPSCHEEAPLPPNNEPLERERVDRRWVRIRRPTVVVGGELTLDQLEISTSSITGISEAPLQVKSNGGALVVDDFGRQRISTTELLNRWIVPLEKGFDFLSLPSGRQIQVPFDQLLVFATNLEPSSLVDEAFLRRIPFKIQVSDPTEQEFQQLFQRLAPPLGFEYRKDAVYYLIEKYYKRTQRPFRYCHPRDLLQLAANFCDFHERKMELTPEAVDAAAKNYFAGL